MRFRNTTYFPLFKLYIQFFLNDKIELCYKIKQKIMINEENVQTLKNQNFI